MRKARLPALITSLPLFSHCTFFAAVLRFLRGRSSTQSYPLIPTAREPQASRIPPAEMPLNVRSVPSNKVPAVERPTRYRRASSVSFVSIPTVTGVRCVISECNT
ncbi:hypothetical protein K438DRAFT_1846650 [Mycena galopus ATCC 62051]|nr:hypothetical protein K438DRAFT_1846650 [Mycena galopus ATCC 62051]